MNIATWNIQGLSRKTNEIISELKELNMDIIVLTETKGSRLEETRIL